MTRFWTNTMGGALGGLLFLAIGCSPGMNNQSAAGCVVTASLASANSAQVSISCSGGVPSYQIVSLSIGGTTLLGTSNVAGATTFSSSTLLTINSSAVTSGALGTVFIRDSTANSAGQSYSFQVGASTGINIGTGCSMVASTTNPAINQSVQYTFSVNGTWGSAPYTFSGFTPGTNGVVVSGISLSGSNQGSASASYSAAGTPTASITVRDATGVSKTCSTQITVGTTGGGGGTGSIACHITGMNYSDGTIAFELIADANPNDRLAITSFDPGLGGTVLNSGYPVVVRYSSGGTKSVTAAAYSTSSGATCNVTPFVFNYGNGGIVPPNTGTACSVPLTVFSNPSGRSVPVQISVGGGASLVTVLFPTNAGVSFYFTSITSAVFYFPYASSMLGYASGYPLTLILRDSKGAQTTCSVSQVIY